MHTIELRSHHLSLLRYLGVSVSLCAHRGRTAEFRILIKFRLLRVEQLARPASLSLPLSWPLLPLVSPPVPEHYRCGTPE